MAKDNRVDLMKKRAHFIKQNILSSDKEEFDEKDLAVQDICKLIGDLEEYDACSISMDGSDDHPNYGGHKRVRRLPRKLFRRNAYKKEDLIYRLDEILTLIDSDAEGGSSKTKSCLSCNAIVSSNAKFCGECGAKL